MTQAGLFDGAVARPKKRGAVPRSSVLAYRDVDRESRGAKVLERLCGWAASGSGWPTSAELAAWLSGGHPDTDTILFVRRGLSDLLSDGLVEHGEMRPCSETGRRCLTWRVVTR